jgi:hypothetical protein
MKRACLVIALLAAGGCSDNVTQKIVEGTLTVAGEVITSPVVAPVIQTATNVSVKVVEGAVAVTEDALLPDATPPDCMTDVDAYAGSQCETDCEEAKRGNDPDAVAALCPDFAR